MDKRKMSKNWPREKTPRESPKTLPISTGVNPKKSLGQNFLRSQKALNQIIEAADLHMDDTVLEVGPGEGVLTSRLLQKAGRVIAVEKDDRLIEILSKKFSEEIAQSRLKLVHADILELDLSSYKLEAASYKLIANIPYYITGALIRRFLSETIQPSRMVLMLQKEVAERIVAKDGKESLLSVSVKEYGTPHYVATVPRGGFHPAPAVDSAIVRVDSISKDVFSDIDERDFFKFLKKAFGQKRKQLQGNLAGYGKTRVQESLENLSLPPAVRAEDVPVAKWKILYKKLAANS